jgi:TonB family protein
MLTLSRLTLFLFLIIKSFSSVAQTPTAADLNKEYVEFKKHAETANWEEALTAGKKAYEIGKSLFTAADKNSAILAYNYGHALKELKHNKEALVILNEALQLYEDIYGKEAYELVPVLMDIGFIKSVESGLDGNLAYQNRALEITEQKYGDDSIEYGFLSIEIGANALTNTPTFKVKRYLTTGYEVLKSHLEATDPRIAYAAFYLGKVELMLNNYESASDYFNETLATFDDPNKPSTSLELSTHGFLVNTYEKLGQSDLATQHCLAIGRMTPFNPDQERQPIFRENPDYPDAYLKSGAEGWVQLSFDIDESGFVRNLKEIKHGGAGSFVQSAIKAVEKWRFAPAFKDGVPIASSTQTLIKFEIDD